jgi:hypothetical protein
MAIEQKPKDNPDRLKETLNGLDLPQQVIDAAITALETSYAELKKDIGGRYYSGCCI